MAERSPEEEEMGRSMGETPVVTSTRDMLEMHAGMSPDEQRLRLSMSPEVAEALASAERDGHKPLAELLRAAELGKDGQADLPSVLRGLAQRLGIGHGVGGGVGVEGVVDVQ